ncbi:putative peptidyl-prolyl cis-trans isomerase-like protein, partial [Leptotrombidium deliense]
MSNRPKVFLDVTPDDEQCGRIVIELLLDVVPRNAGNFRALCTGEKVPVIPNVLIYGGDFTNVNVPGDESSFFEKFARENIDQKYTGPMSIVSMTNSGPDTTSSQFFISKVNLYPLDNKNVVIGSVVEGFDVIQKLESYGSLSGGTKKILVI